MIGRKLSIGVQDFGKLREEGFVYVDKTAMIYELVNKKVPLFLSRPRCFGKSLILSTMKYYWEGKKELFRGFAIEEMEDSKSDAWQSYPVFYFGFEGENYNQIGGLENKLNLMLLGWEELYGNQYSGLSLAGRFHKLLKLAHEKTG